MNHREAASARMRAALAVLLLLVLPGCLEGGEEDVTTSTPPGAASPTPSPPSATPTTPAASPPPGGEAGSVEFRTLAEGQQGGPDVPSRRVFTSEAAWRAEAGAYGEASAQEVDFAAETVIAVSLGQRPSGCFSVAVTRAEQSANGGTLVEVTTYEPSPGAFCASVVTHPFHVVALEGAARQVTFVERNMTYGA